MIRRYDHRHHDPGCGRRRALILPLMARIFPCRLPPVDQRIQFPPLLPRPTSLRRGVEILGCLRNAEPSDEPSRVGLESSSACRPRLRVAADVSEGCSSATPAFISPRAAREDGCLLGIFLPPPVRTSHVAGPGALARSWQTMARAARSSPLMSSRIVLPSRVVVTATSRFFSCERCLLAPLVVTASISRRRESPSSPSRARFRNPAAITQRLVERSRRAVSSRCAHSRCALLVDPTRPCTRILHSCSHRTEGWKPEVLFL